MSTKIYTGHRIRLGEMTLLGFAAKARTELEEVYLDLYGQLVTGLAVALADGRILNEKPPAEFAEHIAGVGDLSPLMAASNILEAAKRRIASTRRRNPVLDLDCDIAFYEDAQNLEYVYAIIVTERNEYLEAFGGLQGVETYAYWNNTDRPDDVSEQEWNERYETWERVLEGTSGGPRGLTLNLLGEDHFGFIWYVSQPERLEGYLPSRDERAKRAASVLALAQMDRDRPKSDEVLSTVGVVRLIESEREAREALEDELAAEIEPRLVDLTGEDLRHFTPVLERLGLLNETEKASYERWRVPGENETTP